jgi:hypothetical protein
VQDWRGTKGQQDNDSPIKWAKKEPKIAKETNRPGGGLGRKHLAEQVILLIGVRNHRIQRPSERIKDIMERTNPTLCLQTQLRACSSKSHGLVYAGTVGWITSNYNFFFFFWARFEIATARPQM